MGIESAVLMAVVAMFVAIIQFAIRMFMVRGASRLQRDIHEKLGIESASMAVSMETDIPTMPSEAEMQADHDRWRRKKAQWHREALAQWQKDFESYLSDEEQTELWAQRELERQESGDDDYPDDRLTLYNDGNIVAWGNIQVPYITAEEYRQQHERRVKAYEQQIEALKEYSAYKY